LNVNPKKWGMPTKPKDVHDVMMWLADYGGGSAPAAVNAVAQVMVGGRRARLPKPPTRFESPHWHALVAEYCWRIERAAMSLKKKITQRPLFGTLPLGSMNAFALDVNGTKVTLLQAGLFHFLNSVSKLLCLCIPLAEEVDFNESGEPGPSLRFARFRRTMRHRTAPGRSRHRSRFILDEKSIGGQVWNNRYDLGRLFIDIFRAYLVEGDVLRGRRFLLSETRLLLNFQLVTSAELFVLGHEYGHIILGHLGTSKPRAAALGGSEVRELPFGWDEEYAADIKGLELMIEAMRGFRFYVPLSVLGPGLFLAAEDMLERVKKGLHDGSFDLGVPEETRSHPPAFVRLLALEESLKNSLGRDQGMACAKMIMLPFTTLTMLFGLTKNEWSEMHHKGVRPTPTLGF
jgi:hypothetical protein